MMRGGPLHTVFTVSNLLHPPAVKTDNPDSIPVTPESGIVLHCYTQPLRHQNASILPCFPAHLANLTRPTSGVIRLPGRQFPVLLSPTPFPSLPAVPARMVPSKEDQLLIAE